MKTHDVCRETAVRIKYDRRTKKRERILITRAKRGYIETKRCSLQKRLGRKL